MTEAHTVEVALEQESNAFPYRMANSVDKVAIAPAELIFGAIQNDRDWWTPIAINDSHWRDGIAHNDAYSRTDRVLSVLDKVGVYPKGSWKETGKIGRYGPIWQATLKVEVPENHVAVKLRLSSSPFGGSKSHRTLIYCTLDEVFNTADDDTPRFSRAYGFEKELIRRSGNIIVKREEIKAIFLELRDKFKGYEREEFNTAACDEAARRLKP
jgi:hypothetical protein